MKAILSIIFGLFTVAVSMAQMPKVVLDDLNGTKVSVDTIGTNGQPVIVDFFATWCGPCLREFSAISKVYQDWQKETNMRLVAISVDKAQALNDVKTLAKDNSWKWDVLLDPDGKVARVFNVQSIPFTIIIDGKGNVVYRHTGYSPGAEAELINKIKEINK